jgi:peptide/nickel transport system permease protein/oligopeptide transport system permease protein
MTTDLPGEVQVLHDQKELSLAVESRPLRSDFWRRLRRNKMAIVSLVFLAGLVLMAIFAPLIAPYDYAQIGTEYRKGPSWDHLMGTDAIGRDVFSRVVYGSRVSLKIGAVATAISLVIGLVFGSIAGFFGGAVDSSISRLTDVFLAIPYIVLTVAIAAVIGKGENTVLVVLGFTTWMGVTRIARASFLSIKQLEYVEAARALGYGKSRIMFRHILPNAIQPLIVYGTITVGSVILAEAALSYLGVGPVDPTPAWGLMVAQGKGDLVNAPHLLFFPGAAICLTVLALVFVGDGLRDALDPKLR